MERNGAFEVVVTKMGFLKSNLYLRITPLTFDEFEKSDFQLPDEGIFDELNSIDPAEREICMMMVVYTV